MRVALLTYSTRPRGGVVHTLHLAEALAEAGVDVTVWTLGRGGDGGFFREIDPRVRVRIVPFPEAPATGTTGTGTSTGTGPSTGTGTSTGAAESVGDRIIRSIAVLRAAFDPDEYDIVHAQDCISANAVDRPIRTVHHLDAFTTPALVACHDRAIVEPRALICVSAAVAAEVDAGWSRQPVVIPNGVDSAPFERAAEPSGEAAREQWRGEIGGDYVLALGGIEPRKGSIDLLEAFAVLRREHPRLVLAFGGGETLFDYRSYRDDFERRARELDIDPRVLGTIENDRVPSLVAGASALGFVSTKEGFGLAAMEALAAGVPVVARDLPVLHEVFGSSVLYAGDVPGIAARLDDAVRGRGAPPAEGRMLARAHSWSRAAAAHVRVYERALAEQR